MKNEFSWQILKKYSHNIFYENQLMGAELIHVDRQPDGQAGLTKSVVTFRNSVNVPTNGV
jgi:hypothetical protein